MPPRKQTREKRVLQGSPRELRHRLTRRLRSQRANVQRPLHSAES